MLTSIVVIVSIYAITAAITAKAWKSWKQGLMWPKALWKDLLDQFKN